MLQTDQRPEQQSTLIVDLMRTALVAPDVAAAVTPMLDCFVERTEAAGAAYFQADGTLYFPRAASGELPAGPGMEAIAAHGLPGETPLLQALQASSVPLFFPDTTLANEAAGFPDLGVASLAAAPVRDMNDEMLGAFLMHTFEQHAWTSFEATLFAAVSGSMASLAARIVAEEQAAAAREGALRALGLALEFRDDDSGGHTDRVTELAIQTGKQMGLDVTSIEALRWGAYLHDIGKVAIPDAVLLKPGKLDDTEWETMRSHSVHGSRFAQELGFLPSMTQEIISHHHEKWDGTGYPNRLAGEAIPLGARIFSVCDVYDALTSVRPYKAAWSHEDAVAEIEKQAGQQFDPKVVNAFLAMLGE